MSTTKSDGIPSRQHRRPLAHSNSTGQLNGTAYSRERRKPLDGNASSAGHAACTSRSRAVSSCSEDVTASSGDRQSRSMDTFKTSALRDSAGVAGGDAAGNGGAQAHATGAYGVLQGSTDVHRKQAVRRSTPAELSVAAEAVKATLAWDYSGAQQAVRRECLLGLGPVEVLRDYGVQMESYGGSAATRGKRQEMEDEWILIDDFVKLNSPQSVTTSYVGLFDGHRGSTCAREAKGYIHRHLSSQITSHTRYADALSDSKTCAQGAQIAYHAIPSLNAVNGGEYSSEVTLSYPVEHATVQSSLSAVDLPRICTDVFSKFDAHYSRAYPLAQDGSTALLSLLEVGSERNWAVLHIVNAGDCRAVLGRSQRALPDVQKVNNNNKCTEPMNDAKALSVEGAPTSAHSEDPTSHPEDSVEMDCSGSDHESCQDDDSSTADVRVDLGHGAAAATPVPDVVVDLGTTRNTATDNSTVKNTAATISTATSTATSTTTTAAAAAAVAVKDITSVQALVVEDLVALRLSEDHKPGTAAETKRILASKEGGVVNMGCPRVSIKGMSQFLAVSRSLGNHHLKKHGPKVIISEPSVTSTALLPFHDAFVILASDGLWDVMSDLEAVQTAGAVFASDEEYNLTKRAVPSRRRKTSAKDAETFAGARLDSNASCMVVRKAAEELVSAALERGSLDNVTVVIIRFVWKI